MMSPLEKTLSRPSVVIGVQRENNGLWMTSASLSGRGLKREESHLGPESVLSVCLSICLSLDQSVGLSVCPGVPKGVWLSGLRS